MLDIYDKINTGSNFENNQVNNDFLVAKEWQLNQTDIKNYTLGGENQDKFVTKGNDKQINIEMQIKNGELIQKNIQENVKDLNNLTAGRLNRHNFFTVGGEQIEGECQ